MSDAPRPDDAPAGPDLVAVSIGNTRTRIGRFEEGGCAAAESHPNDDLAAIVSRVAAWWNAIGARPAAAIVVASVNEPFAARLRSALSDQLGTTTYLVGDDLPVPIGRQLDPETITGIDRLLNAAAAWDRLRQACIVVDAGTAITVDFVDGEGTFHGGAIAPGARMQLRSLHEHTDALPEVEFRAPAVRTFGRSTAEAMLVGVFHGIRGMVWKLVESYAERYGAFPTVVATGGDASLLFEHDELVDRIVPDLTLQGIQVAARHALATDQNGSD